MVSVAAMAMMFCQGPGCGPSFLHMQSAQATLADGNQQRLQNNRGALRALARCVGFVVCLRSTNCIYPPVN